MNVVVLGVRIPGKSMSLNSMSERRGEDYTRFRRCAQVIDARRSRGVFSGPSAHALGSLPFPRFAGVTRARCLLLGANTP